MVVAATAATLFAAGSAVCAILGRAGAAVDCKDETEEDNASSDEFKKM
jgi:hypothetical protein